MPIEIERKFLITDDTWRAAAHKVTSMAQCYLNDLATVDSGAMRNSVQVRIAGDEAFLNLKSRELGHTRQEFDYPVPPADARALLALCVGGVIDKRRHYVMHAGSLWEVDEFLGDNAGLVVAEIELQSAHAPMRPSPARTGSASRPRTRRATTIWPGLAPVLAMERGRARCDRLEGVNPCS